MKYKKRGKPANMVKNKEQVRHFYYRTWHKISKHIDFANGELPFLFVTQKQMAPSRVLLRSCKILTISFCLTYPVVSVGTVTKLDMAVICVLGLERGFGL